MDLETKREECPNFQICASTCVCLCVCVGLCVPICYNIKFGLTNITCKNMNQLKYSLHQLLGKIIAFNSVSFPPIL